MYFMHLAVKVLGIEKNDFRNAFKELVKGGYIIVVNTPGIDKRTYTVDVEKLVDPWQ